MLLAVLAGFAFVASPSYGPDADPGAGAAGGGARRLFAVQMVLSNVASIVPLLALGELADWIGVGRALLLVGLIVLGPGGEHPLQGVAVDARRRVRRSGGVVLRRLTGRQLRPHWEGMGGETRWFIGAAQGEPYATPVKATNSAPLCLRVRRSVRTGCGSASNEGWPGAALVCYHNRTVIALSSNRHGGPRT